ncbi:MAG TPA: nitrite reductase small subunit NirD [Casimicrobiaceae bacterium]|nr:nitrite reductase small subunit NirD [Casimicrobiaceae bacterium]
MNWVRVCSIDDIPRLGARAVVRMNGPPIALFRTASDRVFALIDRCPHRGGPLSQGLVTGERVVCPLHGWTIELSTGTAVAPDEGSARAFTVEVREGDIYLPRDELARSDSSTVAACSI